MSTEWITDRLPTGEDADQFGDVWVTLGNGFVCEWNWRSIKPQMPWRPTNKPAPYVKPKRWRVRWDANAYRWYIVSNYDGLFVATLLLDADALATAQRICDIFNEVMP
jgi:hypothetical protein